MADIASDYGVSDVTLYALLLRDHEGAWRKAQEGRALANKARAIQDLQNLREQLWQAEKAHDALSLARIREQVKLAEIQAKRAEWELERVLRRIYGQDVAQDSGSKLSISLNFAAPQQVEKIVSNQ